MPMLGWPKFCCRPQRSREAIDLGLAKFKAGEYQAAIELFELALELPGSGVMRMAGELPAAVPPCFALRFPAKLRLKVAGGVLDIWR